MISRRFMWLLEEFCTRSGMPYFIHRLGPSPTIVLTGEPMPQFDDYAWEQAFGGRPLHSPCTLIHAGEAKSVSVPDTAGFVEQLLMWGRIQLRDSTDMFTRLQRYCDIAGLRYAAHRLDGDQHIVLLDYDQT